MVNKCKFNVGDVIILKEENNRENYTENFINYEIIIMHIDQMNVYTKDLSGFLEYSINNNWNTPIENINKDFMLHPLFKIPIYQDLISCEVEDGV